MAIRSWIALSPPQMDDGTRAGTARHFCHRNAGRPDHACMDDGLRADIIGACAERAIAKSFSIPWDGRYFNLGEWKNWRRTGHDVGPFEVRASEWDSACLLLHPSDPDDSPFILVIARGHLFCAVGWILGGDGKRVGEWREGQHGRPCFYVPQSALRPMRDLRIRMKSAA